MRTYEALSAAYFLILAIGGLFAPADTSRRAVGCLCALACVVLVSLVSMTATAVREWAPLAYIAAGYWIPSLFVTGTAASPTDTRSEPATATLTRFERWLLRADAWLRPWLPPIPAWTVPLFEVAYLTCYPLVPIGFLLVFIAGTPDDVNRFWSAVLTAGYVCYGTLPWLQSRPPRFLPRPFDSAQGKPFDSAQDKPFDSAQDKPLDSAQDKPLDSAQDKPLDSAQGKPFDSAQGKPRTPPSIARFNVFVLGRISHGWNTFPSGHASMSFAVALMLMPVSVAAALAAAMVATAVAIGAAAGRYHFAVDVIIGAAVALVGCALVLGL